MSDPTVSLRTLIKTVAIISFPALLVLVLLLLGESIELHQFLYSYAAILAATGLLVYFFLSNIAVLTRYVNDLSNDKKVNAPNLGMLSAIKELSQSLVELQRSWQSKKRQMEGVITEREILVDTLPEILIMLDEDQRIVRTNRAARKVFGQNLAGKELREVVDNEILLNAVTAVLQDLKGREVEFRLTEPELHDFRAIIERFPVASVGGIAVIITLNDVTELRRVEKMRADFVANASHEIRTPLASIAGFIETLRGPAKDDEAAREEFLKVMSEQAKRMSTLISDLLSLSKIEMSAHTIPEGEVDISRLMHDEKEHFEWMAKEKNIEIELDYSDSLPTVRGDVNELRQVLHNLLGNAIKYGYADTSVTISARVTSNLPRDPSFIRLNRAVSISVRDRGEGIPKEHLSRLTERFYRVDTARTRKVGGTGLGLSIVKHIVNRHRGVLTIDSVVGQGSVFSVYLPLYEDVS